MTLETLKSNTRKELAALAKRHRVAGWHGMRKEELIEALLDVHRSKLADSAPKVRSIARVKSERHDPRSRAAEKPAGSNHKGFSRAERRTNGRKRSAARANQAPPRTVRRDISTAGADDHVREELVATAHDPHWIHARWVLKRSTVHRAEAALGSDWFRAVPVIRIHAMKFDEVNGSSADWVRDVEIHGECDHWFVPVENPPGSFKLEVGYAAPGGKFFSLARSRKVTTPRPGSRAAERLGFHRSAMARPAVTDPEFEKFLAARAVSYGSAIAGEAAGGKNTDFQLEAELIVSGTSEPDCQLTLQGESIKVGKDGRFSARVSLGNGRQVIPATYISPDGTEKRTIVLAVERNNKKPSRRNTRS